MKYQSVELLIHTLMATLLLAGCQEEVTDAPALSGQNAINSSFAAFDPPEGYEKVVVDFDAPGIVEGDAAEAVAAVYGDVITKVSAYRNGDKDKNEAATILNTADPNTCDEDLEIREDGQNVSGNVLVVQARQACEAGKADDSESGG